MIAAESKAKPPLLCAEAASSTASEAASRTASKGGMDNWPSMDSSLAAEANAAPSLSTEIASSAASEAASRTASKGGSFLPGILLALQVLLLCPE